MLVRTRRFTVLTSVLAACLLSPLRAENKMGPGAAFPSISVGQKTYTDVVVKSVSPRSIMVQHAGGVASIPLKDLSAELQQAFGYDAEAAAARDAEIQRKQEEGNRLREAERAALLANPRVKQKAKADNRTKYDRLLQGFGQSLVVREGVDLRPKFAEFDLRAKSQGRRPSCSVFAVVSALEFQNAELQGKSEKLSEEYVIWATRKVLKRPLGVSASQESQAVEADGQELLDEGRDEGYSLPDVVGAIRAYGVPLQAKMPNNAGRPMSAVEDPAPEVIEDAKRRQQVYVHLVPGENLADQVANCVVALNDGVPVVIGMRWPHYMTVRTGFINAQQPLKDAGHAVTLVGYESKTGRIEDAVFWFKNSYGVKWGIGGYGQVSYRYLVQNLLGGVVLEVRLPE